MAIYQRRRRRRWTRSRVLAPGAVVLAAGVWWGVFRQSNLDPLDLASLVESRPALTSDRPEIGSQSGPRSDVAEKGDTPEPVSQPDSDGPDEQRAASLLASGKQNLERGELVAARTYLSEALRLGVGGADHALIRAELTRIGNETVFSPRVFVNDPLCVRYIIRAGDTLGKIAKANKVSADLLASINEIANKDMIRLGQTIKVVKGPFHAVVTKSTYSLDVYLGNTFVKHFKVGLGADGSTPTGEWRVGTKLRNPTYYPPRGGRIVSADDPDNPLGERWIGLVGVSGEAAGQERYGIHGNTDPASIGRSVSLGCVRMHNEDVEALYTYLVEKNSTVTVLN